MRTKKGITLQRTSPDFVRIIKTIFPNKKMSEATQELSRDLYDAVLFGENIGKKYKKIMQKQNEK